MVVFKDKSHIKTVQLCKNGNYVAINSGYVINHGFATMVLPSDEFGNIISFTPLDTSVCSTLEKMQDQHAEMCEKWRKKYE